MSRWVLAAFLLSAQAEPAPVQIRVAPGEWGEASLPDLTAVLRSAAGALSPRFPGRTLPVIEVSRSKTTPITLFKRGPAGEIRVQLNVEGRRWAQLSFQFAHEMGHIYCGFEDYTNPNMWFEETVCEVSSLYALGRMAESWKTAPPYPNWKDYAAALRKYREERLEKAKLPDGAALADWFREREASLRKDATQRELNLILAGSLLPLFEETPEHWEAIGALNAVRDNPTRSFRQYLQDWSRSAAEKHRPFIAKVAARFGLQLDP